MRQKIFIAIVLSLITFAVAQEQNPDIQAVIEQGDEAYSRFDNEAALTAYRKAVQIDSSNYESLWKLGRAHIDVGFASKDPLQRQYYFIGEKIMRKCVSIYPDSAEGHFFLCAAIGRVALKVGGKEKIRLSQEIKVEAERTLELNPNHDGAMHVLGRWHYELGNLGWVLRAFAKVLYGGIPPGGGNEAAKEWFEKAIAANPNVPLHHLWLGETYIKLNDYDKARQHLEQCLSLPDYYWDDYINKKQARKTLESIQNKN